MKLASLRTLYLISLFFISCLNFNSKGATVDNETIFTVGKYIFRISDGPADGEAWLIGVKPGVTLEGEISIPGSATIEGRRYVVTRIGDKASTPIFLYNSAIRDMPLVTRVTIPSTIQTIHPYEFLGCPAIAEFHVNSSNSRFKDENGLLYYRESPDDSSVWKFFRMPPATKKTRFTINSEDGVEYIMANAFADNKTIKTIVLKGKVWLCAGWSYRNLGIHTINASESSRYTEKDGLLYYGFNNSDFNRLVACPPGLSLPSLSIPSSVREIDSFAFCNTIIPEIYIPPTVNSLGTYTFYNSAIKSLTYNVKSIYGDLTGLCLDCKNLASVEILGDPSDMIKISEAQFMNCSNLSSLNIKSEKIELAGRAFYGCSSLRSFPFEQLMAIHGSISYDTGDDKRSVEHFAYSGVEHAVIPSFCEYIPTGMFKGCPLSQVNINPDGSNNIEYINEDAFRDCDLSEINLAHVYKISPGAFAGNPLEKVIFPIYPEEPIRLCYSAFSASDKTRFYLGDNPMIWKEESRGIYITSSWFSNAPDGWDTLYCPGRASGNYSSGTGEITEIFTIEPVGVKSGFRIEQNSEASDLDFIVKEVTIGTRNTYYEDGLWRLSYGGDVTKQSVALKYIIDGIEQYTYYPAGTFESTETGSILSEDKRKQIEKVYDITGSHRYNSIEGLTSGIYILVYEDGTSEKIAL